MPPSCADSRWKFAMIMRSFAKRAAAQLLLFSTMPIEQDSFLTSAKKSRSDIELIFDLFAVYPIKKEHGTCLADKLVRE